MGRGRAAAKRDERKTIREEIRQIPSPFDPGDLKTTARPDTKDGWLDCDGAAVARADYPALFEAIGTAYGNGNGSTTFNVPDFRGRAVVGAGNGGTGMTGRNRGDKFGQEDHTLLVGQMPVHNHGGTNANGGHNHGGTGTNGGHDHSVSFGGASNTNSNGNSDRLSNYAGDFARGNTGNAGSHAHGISSVNDHSHGITNEGGGNAHNNIQPSGVARWLIKT